MLLVSACLLGHNVKYNGGSNYCQLLAKYLKHEQYLPVCPECMGELPVPRPPCEIKNGSGDAVLKGQARVYCQTGEDVTANFINGAQAVLAKALESNCKYAVLKARSPSCGCGNIYNGCFDGTLITGDGVTSALLKQHGITVYTEADLTNELLQTLLQK